MNPTQGTQQGQVVQPYTTPNAGTPQGAQIDQGNQDIISRLSSGNTMTPTQLQQTSQQAATAGQNIVGMQDPAFRQSYVNNSNIPAIQNNYDQLARQLYQTDKAIAGSGQYQITPQTSSEYAANPGASPLALTDSMLQDGTWRNTNQAFGMNTRKSQNDDVISLLGMLNDSLGKELTSRKNTYASTADKYKAALELANSYLFKNSDIAQNQYNQQQENYRKGLELQTNPDYQLRQIIQSLDTKKGGDFKVSPQDYAAAKRQAAQLGISGEKFDAAADGYRNTSNPYYELTLTGAAEQAQQTSQKAGAAALSSVDDILDSWNKMTPTERTLAKIPGVTSNIPALTPNASAIQSDFLNNIIGPLRASSVGGRLTQQEITWLNNQLPGPGDDAASAQTKIDKMKTNISSKLANPDYVIGANGSAVNLQTPSAGPNPSTVSANNNSKDPLGIR